MTLKTNGPLILPLYLKFTVIIVGVIGLFFILHVGRAVIIPFLFALLVAMLLTGLVGRMERLGLNRVVAIAIAVLGAMAVLGGIAYFITDQVFGFMDGMDGLKENVNGLATEVKDWVQRQLGMKRQQVEAMAESVQQESREKGTAVLRDTLTTAGALFAFLFLLPVYTFLFLLYERHLLGFIARLFPENRHVAVGEVLTSAQGIIQSYLLGLLLETLVVATMNVCGLLLIGVEYALLLGVLSAVLNMVPYVGGLVATGLAMVVALGTGGPTDALWVLLLFTGVQFVDNNLIVPRMVASRVEVNALASIAVVMIGGALWGVPGMFLSLPFAAIIKVICDRVPGLRPLGYLLGDEDPHPDRRIRTLKSGGKKSGARPT